MLFSVVVQSTTETLNDGACSPLLKERTHEADNRKQKRLGAAA